MSEGIREAFFNYNKMFNKRNCAFSVQRMFFIQRIIVLFLITSLLYYKIGLLSVFMLISHLFMFSYFHKIIYDTCCLKLNKEIEEGEIATGFKLFKKINNNKKLFLMIGISIQLFIYIFLL